MITTKDRILELRQQDPELKAVKMSEQLGITKEAIRQNLVKLGQPTNFWKPPPTCVDCGKPNSSHLAKRCRSCFSKAHYIAFTCNECGKVQEFTLSRVRTLKKRNKHHFCSHHCCGKWLARNHSFKKSGGLEIARK